jgi:glycosyltransferase involved in cell wall biosynthesis
VTGSSDGRKEVVFITWAENCSRSDSIAARLGGASFMIYSPFWGSHYVTVVFKYLSQSLKTLKVLFRHKPGIVLVMSPPVIACLPVWLYTKLTGARYVIDAHSGAFIDKRWMWALFIHKFFSRRAAATLITNEFLENIVRRWCANAKIVSDVPICFAQPRSVELSNESNMTFVSTFTRDEPLETFLTAAGLVPTVHFYVTGPKKYADPEVLKRAPENVTFTDFLNDSDYVGLLIASDAVISLTTADHTMQRGAYEAIYLGKPVITSDFPLLRKSFHRGAVHVKNTPEAIAAGVTTMKMNLAKLQGEAGQLRLEKLKRWDAVEEEFNRFLGRKSKDIASSPQPTAQRSF